MIEITASAQEYLRGLLAKQEHDGTGVRIFVSRPGTPYAETCLAYCRPREKSLTTKSSHTKALVLGSKRQAFRFWKRRIDYQADRLGGQLSIKAPNAKMPKVDPDSPLAERITYVLQSEVNPGLAAHGGEVTLIELTDEPVAVLQFGGGCQGCSAVDMTLKDGVERTLLEQIPELKGVRDITDHSDTSNAYYR